MVLEAQGKFDSRANSRSKIKLPHVIRVQSLFIKKKSRKSSDDKLKHEMVKCIINYLGNIYGPEHLLPDDHGWPIWNLPSCVVCPFPPPLYI